MNIQNPEEDRKLSELLRANRQVPPLPPGFKQAVWHRIERAEPAQAAPVWSILARLTETLARPRFALATLSGMLALGVLAGVWQGQDHARGAAQARYLASVAPWQEHARP